MFALFVARAFCATHAEVREILLGNWTATCTALVGGKCLADQFWLQIEESRTKSTISIHVFENPSALLPMKQFTAVFNESSKGNFSLFNGHSLTAAFDFSPEFPPHIFSSGPWGSDMRYNAVMITNKVMQLSLFSSDGAKWQVITFEKQEDDRPLPWYETYFKLLFMGFVFLCSWGVSVVVQKCVMRKRMREAEEILKQEAAQKKRVH